VDDATAHPAGRLAVIADVAESMSAGPPRAPMQPEQRARAVTKDDDFILKVPKRPAIEPQLLIVRVVPELPAAANRFGGDSPEPLLAP
jgi:hypothetical protein